MKNGYHVIEKGEDSFPKALYALKDVPQRLYIMGNINVLNEFSLGVVGARNVSEYRKRDCSKVL